MAGRRKTAEEIIDAAITFMLRESRRKLRRRGSPQEALPIIACTRRRLALQPELRRPDSGTELGAALAAVRERVQGVM
jgi:hypothetical protein